MVDSHVSIRARTDEHSRIGETVGFRLYMFSSDSGCGPSVIKILMVRRSAPSAVELTSSQTDARHPNGSPGSSLRRQVMRCLFSLMPEVALCKAGRDLMAIEVKSAPCTVPIISNR